MGRRLRQGLLVLLTGVLLGLLGILVLQRYKRQDAPAPAPTAPAGAAPAATAAPPVTLPPTAAPLPEGEDGEKKDHGAAAKDLMEAFLRRQKGGWQLCFMQLPDGEPCLVSSAEGPMVSASLIKLYIMGAVLERTERGELKPEAVETPLYHMITISDNSSANELTRLLGGGDAEAGMAAVNVFCAEQGCGDTRMLRLMLADNGLQNYTSAADCARLLAALYRGECVSPGASRQMLSLMLQQQVNDRLPRGLPEGTPIAHKTGDLIGLCWADVGVVFSPGGDYVLCVISDGQASEGEAKSAAVELSREIYEMMNP